MAEFSDGYCDNVRYGPHPWNDWWTQQLMPSLEVKEPTVDWRLELEMAGTKKSNISVKTKGDFVLVSWSNRYGQTQNQSLFIGNKFYDMEKLSVKYEDGLLSLVCPLKPKIIPALPPEDPEIEIEIK